MCDSWFEAFFFDFDGVLADSVEVKTKAFARLYEPYGTEVVGKVVMHHRQNGGMTRTEKFKHYHNVFLKQSLKHVDLKDLSEQFSCLVVDEVVMAKEIPGAQAFLSKWTEIVACFVVSATPEDELKEIIKRRCISPFFKEIMGAPCSKKENISKALSQYNFNPTKCLFFGDAVNDYTAALHCNIPFVGLVAYQESPLLDKYPSIFWKRDFYEIEEWLASSFNYSQPR